MNTFYIVQMLTGRYLAEYEDWFGYTGEMSEAARFHSEFDAIKYAPSNGAFTVIKFYDK